MKLPRYAATVRKDGQRHKLCRGRCSMTHVENCGTCFGFGCYREELGGLIPISAGEAGPDYAGPWEKCPECGGTPSGWTP